MRQIIFHKETKTFHLYNEKISYILCVLENGHLGQLYFGKRLHDKADFSYLVEKCGRPMTSYIYEWDRTFSLEHIRQEYPVYGTTDVGRILRTFKIKKNVEVTDNGKIII